MKSTNLKDKRNVINYNLVDINYILISFVCNNFVGSVLRLTTPVAYLMCENNRKVPNA